MLASAPALQQYLPGITVDAKVSRFVSAAPGIIQAQEAAGTLRRIVVLSLATNGTVTATQLGTLQSLIGPDRLLVLVTAYAPVAWVPGNNDVIRAYAASHSNVVVADWNAAITGHENLLASDHVHPSAKGQAIFAQTIAAAVAGR